MSNSYNRSDFFNYYKINPYSLLKKMENTNKQNKNTNNFTIVNILVFIFTNFFCDNDMYSFWYKNGILLCIMSGNLLFSLYRHLSLLINIQYLFSDYKAYHCLARKKKTKQLFFSHILIIKHLGYFQFLVFLYYNIAAHFQLLTFA